MKYLITLFLSFSVTVFSQDASQILNSLSEKTKSYKNISIDFDFKYENELEDIREKKSGKIIIENEKFKLEIDDQIIVCNGKDQWIYSKETNEVQILEYDRNNEFMNPKNLLNIYEKGYNYRYDKEIEIDSKYYHLIDLFPNEKNNEIIKISLAVSKDENMVKKIEAYESNGAIYTYTVIKSRYNRKNLKFDFDTSKYENIYIIDLR
ncbi:outer membrane lipoprotein carrier protein LolA [Bacteroidota bacterium]|nr:outer membrane lipoprotein carrier protein LolA [Bacteroidota bacterium]MDC3115266.1 outer membrane lipoprotein carrier protein LolA [Bacteroidota bacterium]MDC3230398.1 outer membrane lipoprotein carrier protein LolA [Bacteroidota bacterium]